MPPRSPHPALLFAVIFVVIFLLHVPLLQLPYFWDEAGYYVPAARDLLLTGSPIPHTTVSNAHPPLVLAWVALWWKVIGYAPVVARSAMLFVAAFSLLGLFRLTERIASFQVAVATTFCTALYPVFFAQSSLAQVDLAAAGLTFWGLSAYLGNRRWGTAIWFSLAALAKETAIIAPLALAGWEVLRVLLEQRVKRDGSWAAWLKWAGDDGVEDTGISWVRIFYLLVAVLPLTVWYGYHFSRTGYIFGNPEFFRYNVASTLSFGRFMLALLLRLWQAFGYLHLWILTGAMVLAMFLPAVKDGGVERRRVTIPVQLVFLVVVAAYVGAMALIGGAVLARYMLPAVPLVIIVSLATFRRRLRWWPGAVALVSVVFIAAWFWNPPYGFSPEDNLAYRDYVHLHEDGERFLEARYPMARVLTAWPGSDELSRPWLGYVTRPVQVVRIEDFSVEQVMSAADFETNFDVALVFSTKYEPQQPLLGGTIDRWRAWQDLKTKFFGFHRDLPPAAIAQMLGGRIAFSEKRNGQWIAVIEMERVEDARARPGLTLP